MRCSGRAQARRAPDEKRRAEARRSGRAGNTRQDVRMYSNWVKVVAVVLLVLLGLWIIAVLPN